MTRNHTASLADQETNDDWRCRALQERPGFLVRRLHQIHVALFMEECASEGMTPVQYSVLTALEQIGATEQVVLSRAVGLDRTTTAEVIARLEQRKLVKRRASSKDKRMKTASLTEVGKALLERVQISAARAHSRTLAPLSPADRTVFLKSLMKLVEANNDISRSPVESI